MLTAKQQIISNLQNRVEPVNAIVATLGTEFNFGALQELVEDRLIEVVNISLKDKFGVPFNAPLYRYRARLGQTKLAAVE